MNTTQPDSRPANKLLNRDSYSPTSSDDTYQKWIDINSPKPDDLNRMAQTWQQFEFQPTISIIMPAFNTPRVFLEEAIASVLSQVYPKWELCIADDASTQKHVQDVLASSAAISEQIIVVHRADNGHISAASNSALERATGDFIALLDHDDLLTPDALYRVVELLNQYPTADMVYSDEDKLDDTYQLVFPFFKPDWCPDTFLSRMYTCHLGVYRTALVREIGGFREGYEGSQDYDLVLRLTEKTDQIFHIPHILYHWRIHAQSTAGQTDQKNYAAMAAEKALADALVRRNEPGRVTQAADLVGHFIIRYDLISHPKISIIIPTRDLSAILDTCLTSIYEKSSYRNYEIILIDNGSVEKDTFAVIDKWRKHEPERFKCYRLDIPFNYPKINNYAAQKATGDYLLFLNNDTELITHDWLEAMLEQAQRPSIGAVGALLLYPDNTIQHAGVVVGLGGVAGHGHHYLPANVPGYFGQVMTVNNYLAVTAACLMCRKADFEKVNGLEEALSVAFNDVDLCLKFIEEGLNNIYLPHVVLYHHESKSRGDDSTPEKQARFHQEIMFMREKWLKYIEHDPCYNPNLTLLESDYRIKV